MSNSGSIPGAPDLLVALQLKSSPYAQSPVPDFAHALAFR
jgi:hypothetical protein